MGGPHLLNELATVCRTTGDYPLFDQALTTLQELSDHLGQAEVHNHHRARFLSSGNCQRAQEHHRQALQLARNAGSPLEEARALTGIGRCETADGLPEGSMALRHTS